MPSARWKWGETDPALSGKVLTGYGGRIEILLRGGERRFEVCSILPQSADIGIDLVHVVSDAGNVHEITPVKGHHQPRQVGVELPLGSLVHGDQAGERIDRLPIGARGIGELELLGRGSLPRGRLGRTR